MEEDFHNYGKRLEAQIRILNETKMALTNKEKILEYYNYMQARGLSQARMFRSIISLRQFACTLAKPFQGAREKEVQAYVASLRERGRKPATIATNVKILKVFYKWLNKGEYPACVKNIAYQKAKNKKLPEEMLNEEEVKRLVKHAPSQKAKALISLLWESGARIGEIGTLCMKNIEFDQHGCKITLNGKTGMRRIRVVKCAAYLLEWINLHPESSNPNAPLWLNLQTKPYKRLCYKSLEKIVRTAAEHANIKKPVNPHQFRHSRATYLSQFLTEAQMKEYFGWCQDSSMAARYIHLSGKQVDDAILKLNGIIKEEPKEDNALKREPCPRCKHKNEANNKYCQKCWLPLNQEAMGEIQETQENSQESVISLMRLLELAGNNPHKVRQALAILQQGGI